MNRNIAALMVAQACGQTGPTIVIFLGGIVGARLAPEASFATLPVAVFILGVALFSVPAAAVMARFGRQRGFLCGTVMAFAAGLLAAWAVTLGSFWLFCTATLLVGFNVSFVQQYRFAAAESAAEGKAATAISMLMLAGIVAAFVGPETGNRLKEALPVLYAGSFLGISALAVGGMLALAFFRNAPPVDVSIDGVARPLPQILSNPAFLLALGAAAAAYGVMSFIMTATPISMHVERGIDLDATAIVIQSHMAAMYLPSLVSGVLVNRLGPLRIIWAGLVLLAVCVAVGWYDQSFIHYWAALVLLGVGWNFLFLGGTTLLTQSHRASERFKVQATNDFLVFSLQAVGALSSGVIVYSFGWHAVMWLSLPWLIVLVPLILRYQRMPAAQVA